MNIERFNFPGGEVHVKLTDIPRRPVCQLTHFIRNSDDIMSLLLITDAMRRAGQKNIALTLPYVPYARQDRVMVEGEPLSIKVLADLINAQNYSSVIIWDPHSDVTPALINNCQVVHQHEIVHKNLGVLMGGCSNPVLVCPDAGARKKTLKIAQTCGFKEIVFSDKVRDVATGKITGTIISDRPVIWNKASDHVIVDDICDGGYTFIELAKVLRAAGVVGKIKLYVTHGIFSKGLTVFDGLIDEVYTANSWIPSTRDGGEGMATLHLLTP